MWMGLNIFPWGDRGRGDIVSYNSMNNRSFGKTLMFVFWLLFQQKVDREYSLFFYVGSNKGQWPMKVKMNY